MLTVSWGEPEYCMSQTTTPCHYIMILPSTGAYENTLLSIYTCDPLSENPTCLYNSVLEINAIEIHWVKTHAT